MDNPVADSLARYARRHLETGQAEAWVGLLRPAVALGDPGPGDPVVARLGGMPRIPAGSAWPTWPGRGPLSPILEIDLAALAEMGLDTGLRLPGTGRLLGFHREDPGGPGILDDDLSSQAGARLLHLEQAPHADAPLTPAPEGTTIHPAYPLTARQTSTPCRRRSVLAEAVGSLPDDFVNAMGDEEPYGPGPSSSSCQLGGWSTSWQDDVEYSVSRTTRIGSNLQQAAAAHEQESQHWRTLLFLSATWRMMLGDGALTWLVRNDGDEPVLIETARVTYQTT